MTNYVEQGRKTSIRMARGMQGVKGMGIPLGDRREHQNQNPMMMRNLRADM